MRNENQKQKSARAGDFTGFSVWVEARAATMNLDRTIQIHVGDIGHIRRLKSVIDCKNSKRDILHAQAGPKLAAPSSSEFGSLARKQSSSIQARISRPLGSVSKTDSWRPSMSAIGRPLSSIWKNSHAMSFTSGSSHLDRRAD